VSSKGPSWVIDTNVLVIASTPGPSCNRAAALLDAVSRKCCLALDQEREIEREYFRNISAQTHAAVWFEYMSKRQRFVFFTNRVTRRHARQLLVLSFDPSDWKFVGVATRSGCRALVAEDGDYWQPDVWTYLCQHMRLELFRISDALDRLV